MRTNPFFDAWLFLIGATDDHRALGIFQYIMVGLFWALLFASVWIAFKNWSENSEQRRASHAIIWICRLLIGAQWFQGCLWKLPLPVSGGFQYWTGQMGEHAAFAFHRELVKSVYLPFINVIDPLVFLAELAFAVSLMLGFSVRLVAIVAA
ncbi:MAG: DoxX family protein, partial [Pseudolabrys sp.]